MHEMFAALAEARSLLTRSIQETDDYLKRSRESRPRAVDFECPGCGAYGFTERPNEPCRCGARLRIVEG